jgi:plastocyanin
MKLAATTTCVAAALVLAACGGGEDSTESSSSPAATATATATEAASADTVTVKAFNFQPDPITVKAGTTVKWVNEDGAEHDVTADDESYKGDLEADGGTFEHTFEEPGTYDYVCSLHSGPGMKGQVVVQ